jgi:hypothetical protein
MKKNRIEILRRLYRERAKNPALARIDTSPVSPEILEKLNKDGIVVLENYFTEDFCKEIIQFIDAYIERNKHIMTDVKEKAATQKEYKFGVPMSDGTSFWVDRNESDLRIIHAEKANDTLDKEFFSSSSFLETGESMLQSKLIKNFTMANRTSFRENNLGSGGGWHRDNNYSHGFKALAYLTDVNDDNGPFEYIKKTFTLQNHIFDFPYPDKYQFTDKEINDFIEKNKKLYFRVTGKAGSLVMFNTNGIHRGMPVKKGVRYAITNYYKNPV